MSGSRQYIANAIHQVLLDEGTWMKARDIAPLVSKLVGKKIHPNRVAGNISSRLQGVETRFDTYDDALLYRIRGGEALNIHNLEHI